MHGLRITAAVTEISKIMPNINFWDEVTVDCYNLNGFIYAEHNLL